MLQPASESPEPVARQRAAHLGVQVRRPLVLDAALGLFLQYGYAGTSMEAIAAAADVTKPVVYECYPGKHQLFAALLDREEQRLLGLIAAAQPREWDYDDPEQMIRSGLGALLTGATSAPNSWRVVFQAQYGSEPAVVERVQRARSMITTQLAALVRASLSRAGVEDFERKAQVLAGMFTAVAESTVETMLIGAADWTPDELADFVARVVFRGGRAA